MISSFKTTRFSLGLDVKGSASTAGKGEVIAQTTAGVMAVCTAATAGTGVAGCGVLASALGPVLGKYAISAIGDGWEYFGYGLEALGLKDKPEFTDIANPMFQNALSNLFTARDEVVRSVTKLVLDNRRSRGDTSTTIGVPADSEWILAGKVVSIEDAVLDAFGYYLAQMWAYRPKAAVQCGWVALAKVPEVNSHRGPIPDPRFVLDGSILQPTWDLSCSNVGNRGAAFEAGAAQLSRMYAEQFPYLEEAGRYAVRIVLEYEAVRIKAAQKVQAAAKAAAQAVAAKKSSSAIKTWTESKATNAQAKQTAVILGVVGLVAGGLFAVIKRKK